MQTVDILNASSDEVSNQIVIADGDDPKKWGSSGRVAPNSAVGWISVNGVWQAPAPPAPTLAQLSAQLVTSAQEACQNIVAQITPDANHAAAFQNAASILNGNGGAAPASDPLKTAFANLAAAFGAPSSAAFATLILAVQKASLDLLTAQTVLVNAAHAATTAQGPSGSLQAALAAFETALGAVASEITATGVALSAPSAIAIIGVNA